MGRSTLRVNPYIPYGPPMASYGLPMATLRLLRLLRPPYGLPKHHSRKNLRLINGQPNITKSNCPYDTHHLWIIIDDLWINLNPFLVTILK